MSLEQIITWIVVGGVAGLLADALVKGIKIGLLGAVIVGILGAFVGGWLLGLFGISIGGNILADILNALIGAVVLLLLLKLLRK